LPTRTAVRQRIGLLELATADCCLLSLQDITAALKQYEGAGIDSGDTLTLQVCLPMPCCWGQAACQACHHLGMSCKVSFELHSNTYSVAFIGITDHQRKHFQVVELGAAVVGNAAL